MPAARARYAVAGLADHPARVYLVAERALPERSRSRERRSLVMTKDSVFRTTRVSRLSDHERTEGFLVGCVGHDETVFRPLI